MISVVFRLRLKKRERNKERESNLDKSDTLKDIIKDIDNFILRLLCDADE